MARGASKVSVPATSANLGPGFDSLGLALDLRDELTGELTGSGVSVEVTGEGTGVVPLDESHLVVRAMQRAFAALDESVPGFRLRCHNAVPHARGLGSSAAAVVGGLVLARALVADGAERLPDEALLALATEMEGHPDNVAPALHGGFVISGTDERGEVYAVPSPVDARVCRRGLRAARSRSRPRWRAGCCRRPSRTPTRPPTPVRPRCWWPRSPRDPDQLWRATRDFLHQDYRRPAMPASLDLVDRLRADGHAAVVSGAGPTVLVLVTEGVGAAGVAAYCPAGWTPPPPRRGRRWRAGRGSLIRSACAGSRRGTASEVHFHSRRRPLSCPVVDRQSVPAQRRTEN